MSCPLLDHKAVECASTVTASALELTEVYWWLYQDLGVLVPVLDFRKTPSKALAFYLPSLGECAARSV